MGKGQSASSAHRAIVVDNYRKEGDMDFGEALKAVKEGKRISRFGWNGKNMWVALRQPDFGSKMTLPYLYMKTADDQLVPWLISQTDALANDWDIMP